MPGSGRSAGSKSAGRGKAVKEKPAKQASDAKKPRKSSLVVCSACRARPAATEWAETNSKEEACGDKCMRCVRQWSTHFMHLEWADYAALMATEEHMAKS